MTQEIADLKAAIIARKVAKGAGLMDEKVPYWFTKIDTDKLSITCPRNCVLAQVFDGADRGYVSGLVFLGIPDEAIEYGFTCFFEDEARINEAWRRAIHERLQVRAYFVWQNSGRIDSADYCWHLARTRPGIQSLNPFET